MYNPNENSNNITPTTARKSASVDIRQIFPARKKDDFLKDLQKDVNTFSKYLDLNNEWRNRFEEFNKLESISLDKLNVKFYVINQRIY